MAKLDWIERKRCFKQLKQVFTSIVGSFWGNRADTADDRKRPSFTFVLSMILHTPGRTEDTARFSWRPSFDPYDDYEYKQWGSMTFEEFLAYFKLCTVS